jgi:hypothetical protein
MGTILSLILTSITAPHLMFYPGAQPCGMAGAYVAVAENSWACFYNPAGLGALLERSVGAEFVGLPSADTGFYWSCAAAYPFKHGLAVGVFGSGLFEHQGSGHYASSMNDFDAGVSIAWAPIRWAAVGANIKYFQSVHSGPAATEIVRAPCCDLGMLERYDLPLGQVRAGFAVRNLGPGIPASGDNSGWPVGWRGGVSYEVSADQLLSPDGKALFAPAFGSAAAYWFRHWRLLLSYDITQYFIREFAYEGLTNERPWHSLGVELRPLPFLPIRFGFFRDMNSEAGAGVASGWTGGLGLDFRRFQLDVADDWFAFLPAYPSSPQPRRLRLSLGAGF